MNSDRGIAVMWFAITIVFILAVAAISVDAGGFFSRAYDEQRSGDFACLAGVVEMPDNQQAARTVAAGYLATNLDLPQPSSSNGFNNLSNRWDLRDAGYPWVFELNPGWGSATQMEVRVTKYESARFGKAIGVNQVRIDQESYCELFGAVPGGIFPVGVESGFTGGKIKFSASDCTTEEVSGPGQCDFVDLPRFDDPPGTAAAGSAPQRLLYNLWLGSNQPLRTWNGSPSDEAFCGDTPSTTPCNILDLAGVAGNRASFAYNGLVRGDQNGSSPNKFLGHFEFGRQPRPASQRTTRGAPRSTWTQTHSNNIWNTNLLHNSADCDPSFPPGKDCNGDDEPLATPSVEFQITSYDCQDRRFVWIPEGDFFGPGANQQFHITGFVQAYLVDPIPINTVIDTVDPTERNDSDPDPITGNAVSEISAIVVNLDNADFMYGSEQCPTSPFIAGESQPVIPRLIEP